MKNPKSTNVLVLCCLFILAALATTPAAAGTIFVDSTADGNDDGSSWADAYNHLQNALGMAQSGDRVLVAQGTYYPDTNSTDPNHSNDRKATFHLENGVVIIGGYIGNTKSSTCCLNVNPNKWEIDRNCCCECDPDPNAGPCGCCRDKCTGKTILSGEIGDANTTADNSYHVVNGSGTEPNAILMNVTITAGNADGNNPDNNGGGMINILGSPTLMYCCFIANNAADAGGGMYNMFASPTLISTSFCYNTATWGAGLANFAVSSPKLTNCVFKDNDASQAGGGISNTVISDPVVVNCTFSGNTAGFLGGGIYSNGSDPDVYNSILWSNTADVNGPQIALVANNRRTHIGYCDLQGGKPAVYRDNATVVWNGPIMNLDPMFVEPNNCNLRLRTTSPCLDASNNNLIGAILVDRDGNPRRVEVPAAAPPDDFGVGTPPIADLGAYERPSVIYVDVNAVGDANGVSWQNAYVFLQDALAAAMPGDEIWVAMGEYTPDRFTASPNLQFHPEQTFQLRNGVVLRGGFNGSETDIADKDCDPRSNETVLSGDLFGNDNPLAPFDPSYFENSWNVVTAGPNTEPNAVLDGFSIRGGYANGTSPLTPWNKGGGMHNLGSPTINCCLFEYNWAYDQGGGMYNEGSPTLTDCEFKDNFTRQDGAGLCNIGGSPTLICCDFNMNSGSKLGGGVYNQDGSATLVNCRFSQNGSTHENGGGMASVRSNLRLCDCNFVANLADQDGGAMYNESCPAAKLFQCSFQTNQAGDDGGAMYNLNCTRMLLVNSAFVGNLAPAGWGGGIHNESCNSPQLVNCTFTLNEAEEGGGIYNGYSTPLRINNSILWADIAPDGPEISLEECELFVNDSILQGGEPDIFVWGNVSIHEYNLSMADPLIDNNGRIVDGNSPARDAGNDSALPACVTTDLDGHPRFYGDAVDLGAYEFHNPGYDNDGPPAPACWAYPTQCHGDCDNTGDVKGSDILALKNAWYKSYPDSDYNPCADFDRDGRIGGPDFLILKNNWYKSVPADCPPAGNWPP